MAFIQSILNKFLANSDQDISSHKDHYLQLQRLRIDHDWVAVKITKSGETYKSLILQVDAENHELVIEQLYPPQNLEHIKPGHTVEITSLNNHKPVNFYSRILAREENGDEVSWRLELPEEVGNNQNRNVFRVTVPSEQELEIELYHGNTLLHDVRIINISAEGVKLSFSEQRKDQLSINQSFTNCVIRLPGAITINCDIQLRNLSSIDIDGPQPYLLGGGILTIAKPQQRIKLQQYLAAVQRQQRRLDASNGAL